jgi:ATP-dependent Clp protease, protease subunit
MIDIACIIYLTESQEDHQVAEKTDIIETILSHGIDLKNRRIYFGDLSSGGDGDDGDGGTVSWKTVERAVRAIHIMEAEAPKKPIELHMHSEGGDPPAMHRLCDTIQSSSCQFKFFGGGEISSAATWVMAVCDERYLYPNTSIVIHDSSAGGYDQLPSKLSDAYIAMDSERTSQIKLNQLYADNSRMPIEFWDEMVKRDLYLSADECVALGLADKIVEYKKRGNLRRMRVALLQKEPEQKEFNKMLKKLKERVYLGKNIKIELHVPEEQYDKNVIVDDTPVTDEVYELALSSINPVEPTTK